MYALQSPVKERKKKQQRTLARWSLLLFDTPVLRKHQLSNSYTYMDRQLAYALEGTIDVISGGCTIQARGRWSTGSARRTFGSVSLRNHQASASAFALEASVQDVVVAAEERNFGEVAARMVIEVNDYPGSGANNRHDPKSPGRA